jgi:hypothetical protein
MERGVGLYQALMELNFNCPDEVPDTFSLDDRLAIFEQFWDCAAPRFGDEGSVGWKNALRCRLYESFKNCQFCSKCVNFGFNAFLVLLNIRIEFSHGFTLIHKIDSTFQFAESTFRMKTFQ